MQLYNVLAAAATVLSALLLVQAMPTPEPKDLDDSAPLPPGEYLKNQIPGCQDETDTPLTELQALLSDYCQRVYRNAWDNFVRTSQ